jgi:hypothetical protein
MKVEFSDRNYTLFSRYSGLKVHIAILIQIWWPCIAHMNIGSQYEHSMMMLWSRKTKSRSKRFRQSVKFS